MWIAFGYSGILVVVHIGVLTLDDFELMCIPAFLCWLIILIMVVSV